MNAFVSTTFPNSWRIARADQVTEMIRTQLYPEQFIGKEIFHYSIPSVQEFGTGTLEPGGEIESAKLLIDRAVVLVSKLNPRKATICEAFPHEQITVASSEFVPLAASKCNQRYLFWMLSSETFRQSLDAQVQSVTRSHQRVNPDQIYKFFWSWPDLKLQSAIAAYLDRETAKIDLLIAKKRELIEKLKEQRSALISRTVTRGLPPEAAKAAGLDPNPPMKDSGVEWLGEVPKHWQVSRIKMIAKVGNGSTPSRDEPAYWDDQGFPWLNSSVVNREIVSDSDQYVTDRALRECHLPKVVPPAVLVGITGEGRTRGMASTLVIEATINQHLAFVKPFPKRVSVNFLRRIFDACYQYLRSESGGGGSTKGAITCEQIAALGVTIPPLSEQLAIVTFLDAKLAKLTKTHALVESAIARLTEYRAALITAAVTGQIEVEEP